MMKRMEIGGIIIIVNSSFLLVASVVAVVMLRFGALYTWNYGIDPVQSKLKWKILWATLILILVGLSAAAFNLGVSIIS